MINKKKVAVLISGRGTNLQALIDACKNEAYPVEISIVISNKSGAKGLKRAEEAGIATCAVDYKAFQLREEFDEAIHEILLANSIDIVCLAGFMRILSKSFVAKWENRIINIHPSLLPDFKGLNPHEQALAAGVEKSGCTVHFVTAEMDAGPIILQREVPIHPDDTVETLSSRILEQEHTCYPEALEIVVNSLD